MRSKLDIVQRTSNLEELLLSAETNDQLDNLKLKSLVEKYTLELLGFRYSGSLAVLEKITTDPEFKDFLDSKTRNHDKAPSVLECIAELIY